MAKRKVVKVSTKDFLDATGAIDNKVLEQQFKNITKYGHPAEMPGVTAADKHFNVLVAQRDDAERRVVEQEKTLEQARQTARQWESTYHKASERADKSEDLVSVLKGDLRKLTGEKDHQIAQLEVALEARIRECNDLKDLIVAMAKNLMAQEGM